MGKTLLFCTFVLSTNALPNKFIRSRENLISLSKVREKEDAKTGLRSSSDEETQHIHH
jgi:hypothetical protein